MRRGEVGEAIGYERRGRMIGEWKQGRGSGGSACEGK